MWLDRFVFRYLQDERVRIEYEENSLEQCRDGRVAMPNISKEF